jgi:hypothetical protein
MVVDQAGQTLPVTQYPTITTGWFETTLPHDIHTWIPVIFTQTFASTPLDQGPTRVGSGNIGVCHGNCDVSPQQTGRSANDAGSMAGEMGVGSVGWRVRAVLVGLGLIGMGMCFA